MEMVVSDSQRDWDQYLHLFLMANRSAVQETTGHTPAAVLFRREISCPVTSSLVSDLENMTVDDEYVKNLGKKFNSIHENVRNNIQIANDNNIKERYDINAQPVEYQIGDIDRLYRPQRR